MLNLKLCCFVMAKNYYDIHNDIQHHGAHPQQSDAQSIENGDNLGVVKIGLLLCQIG